MHFPIENDYNPGFLTKKKKKKKIVSRHPFYSGDHVTWPLRAAIFRIRR